MWARRLGSPGADVVRALLEQPRRQVLAGPDVVAAGVGLHGAHRDHDDGQVWPQAAGTALHVEETLGTHVGAEAGLRDDDVGVGQGDPVGDHRRRTGRDVAERATVDECRAPLEGLEEVGLDRVLEDDGHRARGLEVLGGDRLARRGGADDDPAEALAQVGQRRAQGEDHHHLARRGDVEPGLAGDAVEPGTEPDHDVAQGAVVDVEHATPGHVARVEARRAAEVQVVVDHGGQQVVRSGDRVEVAGEMEVDPLHRHDLAVAAAGGPSLDPERRPHRGLAQVDDGIGAARDQALGQTDAGGGLPFAERGRRHGRDDDVLRASPVRSTGTSSAARSILATPRP